MGERGSFFSLVVKSSWINPALDANKLMSQICDKTVVARNLPCKPNIDSVCSTNKGMGEGLGKYIFQSSVEIMINETFHVRASKL